MGKKGPLWWRESDWLLRGSSAANQILLRHSGPILSGVVSQQALRHTLSVNRMTDMCKNITFTTSLRTVTIEILQCAGIFEADWLLKVQNAHLELITDNFRIRCPIHIVTICGVLPTESVQYHFICTAGDPFYHIHANTKKL